MIAASSMAIPSARKKKAPRCAGSGQILSGPAVLELLMPCPVCGRPCKPRHRWEVPVPSAQIPLHRPWQRWVR